MAIFEQAAFADLYAGRGEEIQDLAQTLAKTHALAVKAFESHRARAKQLSSLGDTLGGFGIGLGDFAEGQQAARELESENRQLQESASSYALKGLLVLDRLLEKNEVPPDERRAITTQARTAILQALPDDMRQPWTVYFDQIELIVASAPNGPRDASPARPRL